MDETMTLAQYKETLKSISTRMDWIMEDAQYIDDLLLDPAFGEDFDTEDYAERRMAGYIRERVKSIKSALTTVDALVDAAEEYEATCEMTLKVEKRMNELALKEIERKEKEDK